MFAAVAGLLVLFFLFVSRQGGESRPAVADQLAIPPPSDQQYTTETSQIPPPAGSIENAIPLDDPSVPVEVVAPVAPVVQGDTGDIGGVGGSSSSKTDNDFLASDGPLQAPPASDRPQAVIVETNMISNLIPIMLHFATVLGPSWGMILFTLQERWVEPLSPAFRRLASAGRIEVRFLPPSTQLSDSRAVSAFLASPWIWEQVRPAHRVLLFQSDSILCTKAEAAVEDYFRFDLVGAPIAGQYGQGYNGGLSLRNPRLFLDIAREVDFSASGIEFEDQFFYGEIVKRGGNLPDVEVAKTFSVETIYYETPLGYHQPQRWQSERMNEIEEWCPEVKMLIGRRVN